MSTKKKKFIPKELDTDPIEDSSNEEGRGVTNDVNKEDEYTMVNSREGNDHGHKDNDNDSDDEDNCPIIITKKSKVEGNVNKNKNNSHSEPNPNPNQNPSTTTLTPITAVTYRDPKKVQLKEEKRRKKDIVIKTFSEMPFYRGKFSYFQNIHKAFLILKTMDFKALSTNINEHSKKIEEIESLLLPLSDLKEIIAIITVDPGSTSCGIALVEQATKEPVCVDERSFREKGAIGEIGFNSALNRCHEYFSFFAKLKCVAVVMEDQKAAVIEHHKQIWVNEYHLDAYAVQYAIKGQFGRRALSISPSAMKHFFKMPKVDLGKDDPKKRVVQYEENKKNAVVYGKLYTPISLQDEISREFGDKEHNVYDAILIGVYICKKMDGR